MKNIIEWLKLTGITNIGYIIAFIFAMLFGLKFAAGSFLGIFVYVNFNVIRKLALSKLKGGN